MKNIMIIKTTALLLLSSAAVFSFMTSCEGPQGIAGVDANESCTQCHKSEVVGIAAAQFELSKHNYGEAAFEEAGITICAPCHESEAFKYVCKNNTPATFTLNAATSKFANDYTVPNTVAFGEINCTTCHSSLHSEYDSTDIYPLTNTAPVAMTMWKGAKTIDLTQDESQSNLCVKCHQPRPLATSTTLSNGDVVDYVSLATNPTALFYDPTVGATTNKYFPGYRSHVHYGTVGAIYAGKGGVEFTGSLSYSNSAHTTLASCQDCHMAEVTGKAGGHSFNAVGNFKGCNTAECHPSPLDAKSPKFVDTRAAVKALLNTLGEKITVNGVDILHKNSDAVTNLWVTSTTKKFDGYLDVYDPSLNPTGLLKNPNPSSSWSQTQKDANAALQTITLTNAQMGAIINFQFCLREYSLGIHNTAYTKALLTNSIEALN